MPAGEKIEIKIDTAKKESCTFIVFFLTEKKIEAERICRGQAPAYNAGNNML